MKVLLFIFVTVVVGYAQGPDTLWTRTFTANYGFGGTPGVVSLSNGQTIITGSWGQTGPSGDIFMMRLDSLGAVIDTHAYGTEIQEGGGYLCQTSDRGFGIGATYELTFDYDCYLIKTDSLGNALWQRRYSIPESQQVVAICVTEDNGFILAGQSQYPNHFFYYPFWMKIDANGDTLMTQYLLENWLGEIHGVIQTSDGGYAMTG